MTTRSAEDVISGVLRIAVGGEERIVPTLPIRATREWQARTVSSESAGSPTTGTDMVNLAFDAVLDMVCSYDRTNALGGRDWLEEHADPAQVYAAAQQMAEVAFPFVEDTREILAARIVQAAVGSTLPSSTSGPSPTGASTRARSKSASTRAS